MLAAGRLDTSKFLTHRFDGLENLEQAYEVFEHPQESGALKVGLFR